jgi:hypothetical protein
VTYTSFWRTAALGFSTAIALAACSSGSQVTRVQPVSTSADTPYQNILVIALLAKFGSRKQLEKAVVQQLADLGTHAVASTSMMDTRTPVTRQTFLAMVDKLGSDAVLVSQLADLQQEARKKDANPQATYNVRPTYYYNVWNVELTEYVEPPFIGVESSFVLATQVFSVRDKEAVWAIESKSKFVQEITQPRPYLVFIEEAETITKYLARDGLIAR